ncbi:MAG: hypothetical protein SO147_05065, partial [Clostridia bacterium]|nr:hypothetical protein [Clostridia bacterium]
MKFKKMTAFVAMLLVLTLVTVIPAAAATEDFVTDGGFETWTAGDNLIGSGSYWAKRSQCTAVVTNAEKRSGSNGVLMTPIASTSSGGVEGIATSTKVGITQADDEWYLLEAYLKPASQTPDANLKGKMGVRYKNGLLLQSADFSLSTTDWTRATYVFQANSSNFDATQGYRPVIGIRQDGTFDGDNSAVYIDDVSLTVVQAARLDTPAGSETITIPASGSVTESYTTTVYNEFDETKVSQSRVTWSLQEAKEGVSIDAQSGVLTVSSTATAGTVNIIASQDGVSSQALSVIVNYVPDGGFETWTSGDNLYATESIWAKRSQSTAFVTNAEKRNGNNSVLMTPIASTTSGGVEGISMKTKVEINSADDDWYILNAYVKPASQTPDENLKGKIGIRCKDGGLLLQSPDFELNSDSWTRAHL